MLLILDDFVENFAGCQCYITGCTASYSESKISLNMVINHSVCGQYPKIEYGKNMGPTYSKNKYCKNMLVSENTSMVQFIYIIYLL